MHGRRLPLIGMLLILGLGGCVDEPAAVPSDSPPAPPAQAGAAFDAADTGTIEGRVSWDGPLPDVPPFTVLHAPEVPAPDGKLLTYEENPFRPRFTADGTGLQDLVVYLRGVDPRRARAWPHGPVRVEQAQRRLRIVQDGVESRVGFVQRGAAIEAVNLDAEYHALRARGAAFFTLPFVDADRPTARRLTHTGVVELSSGTGFYWMHAHLFVDDQPYFARTGPDGRFRLEQVPAGRYEAVCWMPSWVVARKEREPESGMVIRLIFAPPVEQVAVVEVRAARTSDAPFVWTRAKVVGNSEK
jgi:hypothetical protein